MAHDRKKHPHRDAIVAWADGAEIEWRRVGLNWKLTNRPKWRGRNEYRIKKSPRTFWVNVYSEDDLAPHPTEESALLARGLSNCETIKVVEVL